MCFLYVLPGFALLSCCVRDKRLTFLETIGLSAGISVSVYPLLYLWTDVIGLQAGVWIAWLPGVYGILYALWKVRSVRAAPEATTAPRSRGRLVLIGLPTLLIAILAVTRLYPVHDMVAPAWGDSVHHTMIIQLFLDHRGLFQSWAPYAPIASFTYHFGFHANIAAWATVTGQSIPQAVIYGGQALNILAVLAIYPLASRLGGRQMAGIAAVIVAGFISLQPGMYVNWGRYTQLTALIILPVWLWMLTVWWHESKRPSRRLLIVIAALSAGLALSHYRVAIIALLAGVAWGLWALWLFRDDWREWLSRTAWLLVSGSVAALLILPWALVISSSKLSEVTHVITDRSRDASGMWGELYVWRTLSDYYAPLLLVAALIALALALWKRRQLGVPVAIWLAVSFVAASPFLLHIPGTGIVTNFLLVVGLYIPIALLTGWLAAELWRMARTLKYVNYVFIALLTTIVALGIVQQIQIVDPIYQLVTDDDESALSWIQENVDEDAQFLVNTFLAFNNRIAAGTDAGWWLPYYTRRSSNLPPMLYSVERLSVEDNREKVRQIVIDVNESAGDPLSLRSTLCEYSISHIYLGDRQGLVGVGVTPLIEPAWLQDNPDFDLLFESGAAQVWSFAHERCQLQ